MNRTANVHCTAIPEVFGEPVVCLAELHGDEYIGKLFKYKVTLKSQVREGSNILPVAANLNLREMIGKEMTIEIELDGIGEGPVGGIGRGKREISGIVTEAKCDGIQEGAALYECVLKPWFSLLTRRSNFKRYQNKSVLEILDEVLSYYPYPVEKRLGKNNYPAREYQVQFGETDHDFLVRLMQEWGIYYYFQHHDRQHTLVLCDGLTSHSEFESAAYHTIAYHGPGAKIDEEYISRFTLSESLRTGSWSTSDFDFTRPNADLSVLNDQPRDTAHSNLNRYEWPGNYSSIDEGEEIARIRMEECRAKGVRASGHGHVRGIVPGYAFTLANHPHADCNQKYLVYKAHFSLIEVDTASGGSDFAYEVAFKAQPVTEVFRPKRTLEKPKAGPQTAIVVGPPGHDIWTDQYGRVLVEFHWERTAPRVDDDCGCDSAQSTFFRVSYPWAGDNFGVVYIPRVGQEVIVQHINGDPDYPVVIGRVYNQLHMPPWDLPANATQSGILTRSSSETQGGPLAVGGARQSGYQNANALRFEDKKGAEQVWLHAEKDLVEEVENDRTITVDGYDRLTVKKDKFTQVNFSSFECVTLLKTVTVGGAMQTTVGGFKNETVALSSSEEVGLAKNSIVGAERSDNIGGFHFVNVGLYQKIIVGGARTVNVGGLYAQNVIGAMETGVGGVSIEKVGLSKTSIVGVDRTDTVGGFHQVGVGGAQSVAVGGAQTVTVGGAQSLVVGGAIVVDAGASLELRCGASTILMTPDLIKINGTLVKIN